MEMSIVKVYTLQIKSHGIKIWGNDSDIYLRLKRQYRLLNLSLLYPYFDKREAKHTTYSILRTEYPFGTFFYSPIANYFYAPCDPSLPSP